MATYSKRSMMRGMLLVSSALAIATGVPAFGQTVVTAPVRQSLDSNGVDLFLGTLNLQTPGLAVGHSDQMLRYNWVWNGYTWSNTANASIVRDGQTLTVDLGTNSDRFTQSGASYVPTEGHGATLSFDGTSIYTYTAPDGTVAHFTRAYARAQTNEAAATDITSPDGAKLMLNWMSVRYCSVIRPGPEQTCGGHETAYRLESIRNQGNYEVTLQYANDSVEDLGLNIKDWYRVTYAAAKNRSLAPGTPLQTMVIDRSADSPQATWIVTGPDNRTTSYRLNGTQLLGITRPGSSSEDITIGYSNFRVSSVSTPAGTTTYSASDDANGVRTVLVANALQQVTTYRFDIALQRMLSQMRVVGGVSTTTTWSYDASGRPVRVTQPEGNYVQLGYDARGNVIERRQMPRPTSGSGDVIVSSASYPPTCTNAAICNQPTSITDARGNVTNYSYDAVHGGVASETAPAATNGVRPETRYAYSQVPAAGSGGTVWRLTGVSTCRTTSTCAGSADEVRTSLSYGTANIEPLSVTTASGDGSLAATVTAAYDTVGNVTSLDGPLAGSADTSRYVYDAVRRRTATIGPDPDGAGPLSPRMTRATYDARGRAALIEAGTSDAAGNGFQALQAVSAGFDAADRKVTESLTAGGATYQVTQYSYDGVGRVECTALRMNEAAWGSLPASACTPGPTGAAGADRISRTSYDEAGRVTQVQGGYGTSVQSNDVSRSYTPNGQVRSETDANGNRTTYDYDHFDRLWKTFYPVMAAGSNSSSDGDYEQLDYDANGNVTGRRLRDGQTPRYDYDALNRRITDDNPGTNVAEVDASYAYDNLGHVLRAQDANGWFSAWEYDALGRMTKQYSNVYANALQYDLAGRRVRHTWSDGFFVTYEYLVTGEMSLIRENGGAALVSFSYDDLGRRTALGRGNGVVSYYGYNAALRLNGLTQDLAGSAQDLTVGYSYNPAGQIVSRTASNDGYAWRGAAAVDRGYAVNGLNQYTASGSVVPSYDLRGNLTGAAGRSYVYNTRNQLFQTEVPGQLFYRNPAGLLNHIIAGSGGAVTNLDYVGAELATEIDGHTNTVLRRYVYGPGSDEPLVWYEGAGTADRRHLVADERGSVIAVTGAAGTAMAINTYDEYGIPGSGNIGRFQYTGQKWIGELGMYDYKARMYSPTLGRFMQTDPIGYGDGMNWYNYVGGDPVNATDPSGLCGNSGHFINSEGVTEYWTEAPCGGGGGGGGLPSYGGGGRRNPGGGRVRGPAQQPHEEQPQNNNTCSSPAISPGEAAAAARGNRSAFWNSRAARGDPLGGTGQSIVNDASGLGWTANAILQGAIADRSPNMGAQAIRAEANQIGVEIMRAHVNAVNTFGSPSAAQIAAYHFQVFGAHGLPNSTFGGSPITGTEAEATLTSRIWRRCR